MINDKHKKTLYKQTSKRQRGTCANGVKENKMGVINAAKKEEKKRKKNK